MSGTKRISALTELASTSVAGEDIVAVVDMSQASVTDKTKHMQVSSLLGSTASDSKPKVSFKTVAAFTSDNNSHIGYSGSGAKFELAEGDIFEAGGFRYSVRATGASDNHVASAGGFKVDVLPVAGTLHVDAFGALGDGMTDDTAALQSAVNAMMALESDLSMTAGKTYVVTDEIDFPKEHSGVVRRFLNVFGNNAKILASGSDFTIFGYTKVLVGALDATNYFINFKDISFEATSGNNVKGIRWGGFVSSSYTNLHFENVDYPFWQEKNDPRDTPDYVQSAYILRCYSNGHKRFATASVTYDCTIDGAIIDVGIDGVWVNNGASAQSGYRLRITNTVFQSHSGRSLLLGGMQALDVDSNYFENNAYDVLFVGTSVQTDGNVVDEVSAGVYWEYFAATTAWTTSEGISASGTYRVNGSKLYVSTSIGACGATAPTHTTGVVSDGGVSWEYIGTYAAWATSTSYTVGDFVSSNSKVYRACTTGESGATAPAHTSGTVHMYGGGMKNNFCQPKGSLATGYRAFIELAENAEYGFDLGGNVAQGGENYYFSRHSKGPFIALGDRNAVTAARLYNSETRPDATKAIFAVGGRFGILSGTDGGVVLNAAARGMEVTHAEYDWVDTTDNKRVPIVIGVAEITPPGFGATGAYPPSTYSTIYPQKGWTAGSFLFNPTPTVAGTAGSQYIVMGWMCTVSGRPGTWVPCRTLTGT